VTLAECNGWGSDLNGPVPYLGMGAIERVVEACERASAGQASGYYDLAMIMKEGRGLSRPVPALARRFFSVAASLGSRPAASELARMGCR
jgi:TPR repeat protein